MCMVERADGALLLVRHTYRSRWGVPGGLLEKGEHPRDAAVRETLEETGLDIELVGEPVVVVDPEPQRVDVIFSARLARAVIAAPAPCSPEIAEVAWFEVDELPELQHETAQALVALARSVRHPSALAGMLREGPSHLRSDAV